MTDDQMPGGGRKHFATTRWSVVLAAAAEPSAPADRALATLCADYWYPLYAYVRRRGYDVDDARDLTQAFFAKLLEKQGLSAATPTRGRFRSFLLASMKNFLASEWRKQTTQKRGGGVTTVAIDYDDAEQRYRIEPADHLTPDAIYERRWALSLLQRAIDDVGRDYVDRGQGAIFDGLKGYLGAAAGAVPYPILAAQLGRNEAAVRAALSRLRARWRKRLRELAAHTVQEGQAHAGQTRPSTYRAGVRRRPPRRDLLLRHGVHGWRHTAAGHRRGPLHARPGPRGRTPYLRSAAVRPRPRRHSPGHQA